jgi:transposase
VPREEVVRTFSVSVPFIKRWLKRRRETGGVEPKPFPGRTPVKGAALKEWLPEQLRDNPYLALEEHCKAFKEAPGGTTTKLYTATMNRASHRLPGGGSPLKKPRQQNLLDGKTTR